MTVDDKVNIILDIIYRSMIDPEIQYITKKLNSIQDVYNFVKSNVRYEKEPFGEDNFQYPTFTLRVGFGDCEDHTILLASILKDMGYPVKLKVVKTGVETYHVYPLVYDNGKWIPCDTTVPEKLGSEVKSRWGWTKVYSV